jgi:transcriptional regulator with XRE-family HTH domain
MAGDEVVGVLQEESNAPARLGEILLAARRARGLKRKQVAALLRISKSDLRAYEGGQRVLPAELCEKVADIYGDELAVAVRVPFEIDAARAAAAPDAYLTTYLEIVKKLRRVKPGESVPLRAADLVALGTALEREPEEVERQLVELLGCTRTDARLLHKELLRYRVVLPVIGLAAGITALTTAHAATASPQPSAPQPVARTSAPAHQVVPSTPTTPTPLPTRTATTVAPAPQPPPPPPPPQPAPAPVAAPVAPPTTEAVTPPSVPPDNTPMSVLPGEHPLRPPTG